MTAPGTGPVTRLLIALPAWPGRAMPLLAVRALPRRDCLAARLPHVRASHQPGGPSAAPACGSSLTGPGLKLVQSVEQLPQVVPDDGGLAVALADDGPPVRAAVGDLRARVGGLVGLVASVFLPAVLAPPAAAAEPARPVETT